MKELLFGWITKGQYQLSFLDSIIMIIEVVVVVLILFGIAYLADYLDDKFHHKKED